MDESKYRPIEVDFDIFQLIVLEKRGFDESDNDALRRLLGLSNPPTQSTPAPRGPYGSWLDQGVELPEGTKLRMTYGGTEHAGTVAGGKWKVGDQYYNTPSQAASGVARTRAGGKTMLNGWKYWYVRRPSDTTWVLLDKLRHVNRR